MLACIPTVGNAGLEDFVNDHFGSAPYFTLYNSDTGEITVLDNRNAHHSHGTCHPLNQLAGHGIDCIICGGMGRRAVESLTGAGIAIYLAESKKVNEIIEAIINKNLNAINPASACQGRGHGHELPSADYGAHHGQCCHGSGSGKSGQGPGGRRGQ